MTFCILRRRTIVKVSLDGVRVFPVGPFQASVSPGNTSFVFQKLRAELHVFCFSWSHIRTPRRLHISSTAATDCSFFPVDIAVRTLLLGRIFAKFEDLRVVQVSDQVLRFFAELVDLLRLAQILNEWFCMSVVLEFLDQPFDSCSCVLYSAARLQKEALHLFCDPRCGYKLHRDFSNRLMVPNMILLPGIVDLVDHIASSILARLVAFWS